MHGLTQDFLKEKPRGRGKNLPNPPKKLSTDFVQFISEIGEKVEFNKNKLKSFANSLVRGSEPGPTPQAPQALGYASGYMK